MPRVWKWSGKGLLWLWPLACATLAIANEDTANSAKLEFFERQVRPIFVNHCHACHSADTKPAGGLRVDDHQGLLVGGAAGAAVVPGKPAESLLLQRVAADAKKRMPAEGQPLSDQQIAVLRQWIEEGAVWPAIQVKVERDRADYVALRKSHWAFQPLARPPVPTPADAAWARDDVDRFVQAKLEAESLSPVADADKATLLRRATYDLTGLSPTPEELDAFHSDESSNAFEIVVDRLLKSPAFGEQWGRHWLDVARYGESTGPSRNIPYPHAWRYRDYVIDAVNQDVPFNQFVREQVAGDLLPAADDVQRSRRLIATGFLALGVKDVNQRFPIRFQMDNVDEQVDVVTRSVLGLTVSCARCHDHKFDPIPQADYYALAGIFTSTEMHAGLRSQMGGSGLAYYVPKKLVVLAGDLPPADPAEVARLTEEVKVAKEKWDAVRGKPEGLAKGPDGVPHQRKLRDAFEALQARLNALSDPAARGLVAHGVRDADKVGDTALRVRGEAEKLGPVIPRGYLAAFEVPGAPQVDGAASGRLQLAEWLTSDANPLTARVFVNRVWAHLFGRGLVSTVDNFGVTGTSPSHPELLDHLARSAVDDGWSLKRLVRRLVLTRTYQLGPTAMADHVARDPDNQWLWRHAPRRLTAEELRDALLAAADRLDRTRPAGSPAGKLRMVEMADNGGEAKAIHDQALASTLRSVYLPQLRGLTPRTLEAFDPVEQSLVTGSREVTTVPGQALYLLNAPFVRQQSEAFANRVAAVASGDEARVRAAYRIAFNREPTDSETTRSLAFLADYAVQTASAREKPERTPEDLAAAWLAFTQALFASAEFRYVR